MPFFEFDNRKVFFETCGNGNPLILLHGNSVSSKMFATEKLFYSKYFKVYLIDYLGHGQSDRLDKFRDDFWFYNSLTVEKLIELENLKYVNLIGTSGGALVGLNLCSNNKSSVKKAIFDSFFGFRIEFELAQKIYLSRQKGINQLLASAFWRYQHGRDWKKIVKLDAEMLVNVARNSLPVIYGSLEAIDTQILFTASLQDELIPNIKERTEEVARLIPKSDVFISNTGKHPLMITQKKLFRKLAIEFLKNN